MKVILTTVDKKRSKLYDLDGTDTVGQTKAMWACDWRCNVDSFELLLEAKVLTDNIELRSLSLSFPDTLDLLVDKKVLLSVRLMGPSGRLKTLSTALSVRAENLYDTARKALGIAESHPVRFRCQEKIVCGDRTLSESGVDAASVVDVEVGWRTIVKQDESDAEVILYHSQVLEAVRSSEQRFLCGMLSPSGSAEVEHLLKKDLANPNAVQLVLEGVKAPSNCLPAAKRPRLASQRERQPSQLRIVAPAPESLELSDDESLDDAPPELTVAPNMGIVSLRMPDGYLLRCGFDPRDTVQTLIDGLRSKGHLFRVDDLIVPVRALFLVEDRSLRDFYGSLWRQRTLEECGVADGTEVKVITTLPQKVVVLFGDVGGEKQTVTVARGENCWEHIRGKLSLPADKTFNVCCQRMLFSSVRRVDRLGVDSMTDDGLLFLNEDDGKEMFFAEPCVQHGWEYLSPTQGLRAPPVGDSVLFIDSITFYESHIFLGEFELEMEVPACAVHDPKYLVMLQGLLLVGGHGYRRRVLLLDANSDEYFDTLSGEILTREQVSVKLVQGLGLSEQRVGILFEDTDKIPRWPLPENGSIVVFTRWRVHLSVVNHRIRRSGHREPVGGQWIRREWSEFRAAFNKNVTRKRDERDSSSE